MARKTTGNNHGAAWTTKDFAAIRRLVKAGASGKSIAKELDARRAPSIRRRVSRASRCQHGRRYGDRPWPRRRRPPHRRRVVAAS